MSGLTQGFWTREFGPEYEVPQAVTATLFDVSWHNDTAPSFIRVKDVRLFDEADTEMCPRLWVEHVDPCHREDGPDAPRYVVTPPGPHGEAPLYEGDDVEAALEWIEVAS